MPAPREVLARRLAFQAAGCYALGSPFYGALLKSAVLDLDSEGPVWRVLDGFEGESGWAAIALRLMGAVHRLVLTGRVPGLARHYPSTGGDGDAAAAWPVFREVLVDLRDEIRRLVRRGCQTNEVGRSAALLGGFLEVAHRTRLPLRILEVGASAGLNLRWDRYRYEAAGGAWGDPLSPVRFEGFFEVAPPFTRDATVVERRGCDLAPIDLTSEEGVLTLRSFVWADQVARMSLLDAALALALEDPLEVERMDAASFVERELAKPIHGVATVVYHSVFLQYLDGGGRQRLDDVIDAGVASAAPEAPVHRLSMEPNHEKPGFDVRLGKELLGTCRAHGTEVRWLVR
ncbi:MAG: DUF2332 domain-containing protein [Candidatus Dormiibacterota bacterium]